MTLKELYKTADYKNSHGMLFHGDCLEIMKNIEDLSELNSMKFISMSPKKG